MSAADPTQRDIFTISRLNSEVRAVLEGSFPLLWVEGEISNLATPRSGHLYFSLKDAHAQVRCALFKGKRQLLRFEPGNGEQVLARARISFYEPRGDFQLIIEHLEPAGAGTAQREFEALKAKLQAEGLFDSARKRELPLFPRRVGIVTSPSGAAIRDVLNVFRRRAPHLQITIYPAQVQGQSAPGELHDALQLALSRAECDVLLLTRGGGSIEDLAAFNDERLARAIAAAHIPVVSAVGHEIDFTISDFVADRRAPTPSAAAELISPDTDALLRSIDKQRQRIIGALRRSLQAERRQLGTLVGRLQRAAPASRLRQQQQRLDSLDLRLARGMRAALARKHKDIDMLSQRLLSHSPARRLLLLQQRFTPLADRLNQAWRRAHERRHARLSANARQLNAVSPLATMQRGFAVLRRADKSVVTHTSQVDVGESVEALLADGRLDLEVTRVSEQSIFKPLDDVQEQD
ncbi:exodeoxyribonuclease VII large subunit [Thiosocius teredinicola]|uniref:exodeoxyribonuclease VII large subunit n=1 Tax=Thiosocius teredinicola TaxID=1973002 RepID=UPI000990C4DA